MSANGIGGVHSNKSSGSIASRKLSQLKSSLFSQRNNNNSTEIRSSIPSSPRLNSNNHHHLISSTGSSTTGGVLLNTLSKSARSNTLSALIRQQSNGNSSIKQSSSTEFEPQSKNYTEKSSASREIPSTSREGRRLNVAAELNSVVNSQKNTKPIESNAQMPSNSISDEASAGSPTVLKVEKLNTSLNAAERGTFSRKTSNSQVTQHAFHSVDEVSVTESELLGVASDKISPNSSHRTFSPTEEAWKEYASSLKSPPLTRERVNSYSGPRSHRRNEILNTIQQNEMNGEQVLQMLDSNVLYSAYGPSVTMKELREKLMKKGETKVTFVILTNYLAKDCVRQFDDSLDRIGESCHDTSALVIIGSGPPKFIPFFCKKAGIKDSTEELLEEEELPGNEDEKSGNGLIHYVFSDPERMLYCMLTMYGATKVRSTQLRASKVASSSLVSRFQQYNKLAESSTKGPKSQYLCYITIDIQNEKLVESRLDVSEHYLCA
eukprot:CAMPEP_0182441922 /NCGR_PEP_ID=MMETSP1172-20130603/907_1 /TAXON_ID=708627 /ORGANISM="Timspurckia oligopyrenoides, Strain CCMP3278" /LENGTH=491 /DNA_ID=CAMNT_0024636525 /DNA_START=152 /DNA_END=1627 /DNA_ORIENTATION=+